MKKLHVYISFFACLLTSFGAFAQERPVGVPVIEKAIDQKKYQEADKMLQKSTSYFLSKNNIDSVLRYVSLKGKIINGLKGEAAATTSVFSFVDQLRSKNATPRQLARAYRQAGYYFYAVNKFQEAYKTSELQLESALKISPISQPDIAEAWFYLGEYAHFLNDINLALKNYRKAYQIRLKNKSTTPEDMYESLGGMAKVMLSLSRTDSASFFYQKSLISLSKMKPVNDNKYHRPAVIYKNLAIISNVEGKSEEAIQYSHKAIDLLKKYTNSGEPAESTHGAKVDMCRTIENLSIFYSQIGNISRANDLLRYSYELKKAILLGNDPEILSTEVLLGSNYNNIGDYDNARYYLNNAIQRARKIDGGAFFSLGDAWYILASVNNNTKNKTQAKKCFAIADSLYELAYQGFYDDMYRDFLRNLSVFYAQNGEHAKALIRAQKVYKHLQSTGEGESLQGFYQLLNIAKVNYYANRYKDAIRYSDLALKIVNKRLKEGKSKLDSVKWEVYKPQCILVYAISSYELQQKKDTAFLRSILTKLDGALRILESRKGLLDDVSNINFLIEYNRELIDFSKKIALELHGVTSNSMYLEKFINLHESGLYGRIRSRLDQEQAIKFAYLPQSVLAEEADLKEKIKASLTSEDQTSDVIRDYLQAVTLWEVHLEKVKNRYPDYYNLRYATLFKPLPQLRSAIPERTTLVRYYFVDSALVALIADKHNEQIIPLSSAGLEDNIRKFLLHKSNEKSQLALLHDMYRQLWAPLASSVKTGKVIIIPDGVLYNLGFDMLPFEPVDQYKQLLDKSLLAKHTISYHYSIFMLDAQSRQSSINHNYVAFAPGFSDDLKKNYLDKVKDSISLDRNYMTLLPQPTANAIAKKIRQLIGGDIYLEKESTQTSFRKYAGNHKVIHIATHAEYNNASPEKSGLIFAKDASGNDSNRLYLSDIFNCDLSSDLTLLTACESGRPGYQDGEGMVSLAHAFNYAGSKNILTALWKIDEQSSSRITESFLKYVKDGMPTDEALRMAKLDYLGKADGRMADPGYWSGLVLMGRPAVVRFTKEADYSVWTAAGVFLISAALLFISRRRSGQKAA